MDEEVIANLADPTLDLEVTIYRRIFDGLEPIAGDYSGVIQHKGLIIGTIAMDQGCYVALNYKQAAWQANCTAATAPSWKSFKDDLLRLSQSFTRKYLANRNP